MRKKFIAAIMAGALSVGMLSTGVFATETSDLKGEVYAIYCSQPQQFHGRDPEGFQ